MERSSFLKRTNLSWAAGRQQPWWCFWKAYTKLCVWFTRGVHRMVDIFDKVAYKWIWFICGDKIGGRSLALSGIARVAWTVSKLAAKLELQVAMRITQVVGGIIWHIIFFFARIYLQYFLAWSFTLTIHDQFLRPFWHTNICLFCNGDPYVYDFKHSLL